MSHKNCCGNCHKKTASDPSSRNYSKDVKNKANENSPFGENEPSIRTDYK